MKALIILGPPGSGKSTQAKHALDFFNERHIPFAHFDLGHALELIFNSAEEKNNLRHSEQKKLFDSGKLVDWEWAKAITETELRRIRDAKSGVILSGEPRDLDQAKDLFPILESLFGADALMVVWIDIPESEIRYRLAQRGRATMDAPEVITVRLEEYRRRTEPILNWVKEQGYPVAVINGNDTEAAIADQLKNILAEKITADEAKN